MNRRQKLKKLKKDNKFMWDIIKRTPEMKWLYDAYQQPLNVTHYTMDFEKKCFRRAFPPYMLDRKEFEEHIKRALIGDIAEGIADNIKFETENHGGAKAITATLYVGKVR